MIRPVFLLAAGAAVSVLLVSQSALSQSDGAQRPADEDVVLKAMHDEMERSRQLRAVGGQDTPYFFSYDLTDSENLTISATLGSAISVSRAHARIPGIEVRVGGYDFDNTNHINSGRSSSARLDSGWPLDDNYAALRECFWLATDFAYKNAVESMGRKRASLNNAAAAVDPLPDFSKVAPVVSLAKVTHRKIDDDAWTARIARLSSAFSGYPEILTSAVEFQAIDGITELLNSEGTEIRYGDRIDYLMARAEAQAPDGMLVRDAVGIQALDLDKLPSEADMKRALTEVAEHVRVLTHAPNGENYTGPVLFEPQAAAQLLAQLVGDNLRIPRKPLSDTGRTVTFNPGEFETKIGSRVLPDFLDVTDNPLETSWNGKPLVGYYAFDLEGVAPKPVSVIEKGILKSFLTTRQPVKGFAASNGHARLNGSYGARSAAIANLFIKASQTTPLADLKKRLIQTSQERGKPYGMLVRKLDYPFSAGTGELQGLAQASSQSGGSARPVSPPLLVYRVYPDGREELVRGLRFRGISTRTLRDILAASEESALFDFINNGAPLAIMGAGGYVAGTSVVSPGLLFDEIEFEFPQEQLPKPAVVPPPN